jgi:hypothetical protein
MEEILQIQEISILNTIQLHVSGLNGMASNPYMQKIRITVDISLKIGYTGSLNFSCNIYSTYLQLILLNTPNLKF